MVPDRPLPAPASLTSLVLPPRVCGRVWSLLPAPASLTARLPACLATSRPALPCPAPPPPPPHLIAATVAASSRGTAVLGLAGISFVHLLAYSVWLGSIFWTTFVAGIVMFKNLPRQQFGKVQSKLFPM